MWLLLPAVAFADTPLSIKQLMFRVSYYLINPLIIVGFVAALLYFIWGLIDFLRKRDVSAAAGQEGRDHMLYGLIGLVIMISAFAIMRLIAQTIGSTIVTP
jgi:uncharacterized membrane protein